MNLISFLQTQFALFHSICCICFFVNCRDNPQQLACFGTSSITLVIIHNIWYMYIYIIYIHIHILVHIHWSIHIYSPIYIYVFFYLYIYISIYVILLVWLWIYLPICLSILADLFWFEHKRTNQMVCKGMQALIFLCVPYTIHEALWKHVSPRHNLSRL
jgi:hypothetical protein